MRAVVVMPPTKEGPSRTYAAAHAAHAACPSAKRSRSACRCGTGRPGRTTAARSTATSRCCPTSWDGASRAPWCRWRAALRGDDSEFPWGEPDPVGVGIALQVLSCLPERNAIDKGPVYRIAYREVSQDRSVPAAIPRAPAGTKTRRTKRFLKTSEAGTFVGLSGKTLARMRVTGGGPVYSKRGTRVIYDIADLEGWMEEGKRRHTSEAANQN